MTIEGYVISYLSSVLDVSVSSLVPRPTPSSFVTIEKTGSRISNYIQSATLAVQSWGDSQEEAMILNEQVKAALSAMDNNAEISSVQCDSDYNFTDESTKHYRYQAVFTIVYFL